MTRRARPVLGDLSADAKAARAPLRPDELVEAQHDRVHRDPGRARAARTPRWRVLRDRDGREIYRSLRRSWRDVVQDAIRAGVSMRRADLRGKNLAGLKANRVSFDLADLRGANLESADISFATFASADMRGAWMQYVHAAHAVFISADLRDADLRDAWMYASDMRDSDMRGARLDWAYMRAADLRGARLQHANTFEANLRDALR